jgi:hypothetical protein
VQVCGQTNVARGAEMVDAWIVEVDWGNMTQTYWIGISPRVLLKQVTPISADEVVVFLG